MFYTPSEDLFSFDNQPTIQRRELPKESFSDSPLRNSSSISPLVLGLKSDLPVSNSILDTLLFEIISRLSALLLLALCSPILLAIALAIRLLEGGPAIYTQKRVGRYGKIFTIYKFRTMRKDAEDDGPFICTTYDDERITPFGRFLRKSKLDELPQLINVLRGEMAFVGPRPERPVFHQKNRVIPNWEKRLLVKPGITGIAQISPMISHDPAEKIQADLEYIKNRSLILNAKILLKTAKILIKK